MIDHTVCLRGCFCNFGSLVRRQVENLNAARGDLDFMVMVIQNSCGGVSVLTVNGMSTASSFK